MTEAERTQQYVENRLRLFVYEAEETLHDDYDGKVSEIAEEIIRFVRTQPAEVGEGGK